MVWAHCLAHPLNSNVERVKKIDHQKFVGSFNWLIRKSALWVLINQGTVVEKLICDIAYHNTTQN